MTDYRGDEFRIEPPPSATTGALAASLPESNRRGLIPYVAVGMVAAAFAGFLWFAYKNSGALPSDGNVPEVRADASPFKTQPPEPGGLQVPHQDSTLLNGTPESPTAETLLATSEVPPTRTEDPALETAPELTDESAAEPSPQNITVSTAPDATPADTQPVETIAPEMPAPRPPGPAANPVAAGNPRAAPNQMVASAPLPAPLEMPGDMPPPPVASNPDLTTSSIETETKVMVDPHADRFPASDEKPAPAPEVVTADIRDATAKPVEVAIAATRPVPPLPSVSQRPQAAKPASAVSGGSWAVQIGAVRSDADAKAEWKRLQRKYSAQLGALKLTVKTANLGERGTWYRIQGGPLDKATAARVCGELKSANVGCLVVRK